MQQMQEQASVRGGNEVKVHTLELRGCSPTPLMNYLKALGTFRIIASQKDTEARAFWRNGHFHLRCCLSLEELMEFFLEEYSPAPVIGPWNNSSGFSPPDKVEGRGLSYIKNSTDGRLELYRQAISVAEEVLRGANLDKEAIVARLRRHLPDEALPWLDAVIVIGPEARGGAQLGYPPLLGTGGNDGAMNFTVHFMSRIMEVMTDTAGSQGWLNDSLLGTVSKPLKSEKVGFYNASAAGGANADQNFEAPSVINPWDYILNVEGTLFFSGSISRRHSAARGMGKSAFPFTVNMTPAGYGSAATAEERSSRGELWLPLWDQPATSREIANLFSEGRARLGRTPVRDGLDFTRAIASLGISRGLSGFVRFGLNKRRGDAYLATPHGFYETRKAPVEGIRLLDEIDDWLGRLKKAESGSGGGVPHAFASSVNRLTEAMLAFSMHGGVRNLQAVLTALGNAEMALAKTPSLRREDGASVSPLTLHDSGWLNQCNDQSPEYRVAASLASMVRVDGVAGPFRSELEPVSVTRGRAAWTDARTRIVSPGENLIRMLSEIMRHRCLEWSRHELKDPPLGAMLQARLDDIRLLLQGILDERRITGLMLGLSLLEEKSFRSGDPPLKQGSPGLPRDYILLKTQYLHSSMRWNDEPVEMGRENYITTLLKSNRVAEACRLAERRLRISGLRPFSSFGQSGIEGERLLACLLVPIDIGVFEREALPMIIKGGTSNGL